MKSIGSVSTNVVEVALTQLSKLVFLFQYLHLEDLSFQKNTKFLANG